MFRGLRAIVMSATSPFVVVTLVLLLGSCAKKSVEPDAPQISNPQKPQKVLESIGKLRPSFYWIALETEDGKPKDQKILDVNGDVLATVSANYIKQLRMEGTGRLLDGRVINFHKRFTLPDGTQEIRWRVCGPAAPYGFGFEDVPLVPFRSVAVDPKVIPLGSMVYIPAAKGTLLPDGAIHDGYFGAVDIGSLIQDRKIDVFTSFGDQSSYFQANGMVHAKEIEVFLVK